MLENEIPFGSCGKIDYCGVFKHRHPEAAFWKGDHVKSGS